MTTRTLVTASTPGADMSQGQLNYTRRPLDVALQQDGLLAVQMPDGTEAYTRNGDMQVSPARQLTIQGQPVMGDNVARLQCRSRRAADYLRRTAPFPRWKRATEPNTVGQLGRLKLVKATGRKWRVVMTAFFRLSRNRHRLRVAMRPCKLTPASL